MQIRDNIHQEILSGNFKAGQQIPSEEDLAKIYNVCRMTVRHGLSELLAESVLYKQHGVGTFVSHSRIEANSTRLTSFSGNANEQGIVSRSRLLGIETLMAEGPVKEALTLQDDTFVICIKRLRTADKQPVSIQHSYMPEAFCPPNCTNYDWSTQSHYDLLETNGRSPKRAIETISAVIASVEHAKLLELNKGDPLINIERITYDSSNRPMEFVRTWNRPDRYKCTISLYHRNR